MHVWDAIRAKRAIRHYREDPLPDAIIRRILDAGRRAQSAKNSQPWDFIAITKRETLQALSETSQWLGHMAHAALCVAIVTKSEDNDRYAWHMFDCGQAAAYMQLAAEEQGVGSCPGTIYDEAKARRILGFPEDKSLRLVLTFGYPDSDHQRQGMGKAGRRDFDEVVHWEQWGVRS